MRPISRLSLLSLPLLTFVAASASAEILHPRYAISIMSPDIDEAMRVANCFAYTTCLDFVPLVGIRNQVFTVIVGVDADLEKTKTALERCELRGLEKSLSFYEAGKSDAPLAVAPSALAKKAKDPTPAFISMRDLTPERAGVLAASMKSALGHGVDYAAVDELREGMGVPKSGYPSELVPKGALDGALGVTRSVDSIGYISFDESVVREDFCLFAQTLKHEYEHAYQHRVAEACAKRGAKSIFGSHKFGELYAHLNQVSVAKRFCPAEADAWKNAVLRLIVESKYLAEKGVDYR